MDITKTENVERGTYGKMKNGNKAGMCATSYECACGRLGFVTIFHFPVPHALFPLPVLETSSPQVLVLFKWLFSVPGSFSRLTCTSSRSSIRYHNKYYERVSKSRNRHNPLPHGIVKILITKRTYLANYVCRLQTHLSCSTAGTVSNFWRLLSIDVINFMLHVQTHDSIKVSLKTQSSVLIKRKLGMAFVFMVTHWDKFKR